MNVHIEPQIINQGGKPAFAVIPWIEYQRMLGKEEAEVWFPNDVVKATSRGDSLIKAWREHFGLKQEELAVKTGMKQSALARLEKTAADKPPRPATLARLAEALNITVEQLEE